VKPELNSVFVCASVCVLACLACHNPAREVAERDARDHARLAAIVDADQLFDRALKAADDASRAGEDRRAADLLEGEATRAANDAIAEAEREPLESPWAGARRDALVRVLQDRQASLGEYARALRGEDLEAKLAAVQAQLELQKRALEAASSALSSPSSTAVTGASLDAS
jgi:hypothetical protein